MTAFAARRLLCLTVVALLCAPLGACGFKPLYGTGDNSPTSPEVAASLSAILINPIADSDGMKLRQALRERFQVAEATGRPRYTLDVQLRAATQELGIRTDATASRANRIYTARFTLVEGGQRVFADQVQAIVSYNILDDQYATVASSANAGERALKQLGDEIKIRIAVYLENRLHETASSK